MFLRPHTVGRSVLIPVMLFGSALTSQAQTSSSTVDSAAPPSSEDVVSVDAIITALYESISGPAGRERDWTRFRSLFAPEGRLIPTFVPEGTNSIRSAVYNVDSYVDGSGQQMQERGFFQVEVGRVTEEFENIAHAFSAYESRLTADGPLMAQGINSVQLRWDGHRWWIVDVLWRNGGPTLDIPDKYLGR